MGLESLETAPAARSLDDPGVDVVFGQGSVSEVLPEVARGGVGEPGLVGQVARSLGHVRDQHLEPTGRD